MSDSTDSNTRAQLAALEIGSGITVNTKSVQAILEGWLNETTLDKKWKIERYCSMIDWMRQNWYYVAGATAVIVAVCYQLGLLCPEENQPAVFENQPWPPKTP